MNSTDMSAYDAPTDNEASILATTKTKSVPFDFTVFVGSGESMQEFKCHKLDLARASMYLDTLLSSRTDESVSHYLSYPYKDPAGFTMFCEYINDREGFEFTSRKVKKLLPWFHEFQMDEELVLCDGYLSKVYQRASLFGINNNLPYNDSAGTSFWHKEKQTGESDSTYQERLRKRMRTFKKTLSIIKLANEYNLKFTEELFGKGMANLMNSITHTDDLFDLDVVKTLLCMVSPLKVEQFGLRMSGEGSKSLWRAFEKILQPHTFTLTQEVVASQAFHLLVYSYMQIKIEKERSLAQQRNCQDKLEMMRAQAQQSSMEIKKSGKRVIRAFVHMHPKSLYKKMPDHRSMRKFGRPAEKINSYVERLYMETIDNYYRQNVEDFKRFGVKPPAYYNSS